MKNRVLLISLAVVLALSVGLVGCAGAPPPSPTGPNGTVVIVRASLAKQTFLPWTGGAIEKNYLSGTIYESLTMRDRLGNLLPCLATNWSMTPDGKNWTVTIRQGIPFHDASGKTWGNMTAADVKYTFERIASNGTNTAPAYPASVSHIAGGLRGDLGSNITAAIEVVDNYTLIFHLKVVDIAFMKTYTGPDMMGVVCKSYITANGDEVAASVPVGTGPYVKDSQVAGAYIKLRVTDAVGDNWSTHWRFGPLTASDPTKYFQYLKFMIVPEESARVTGLLSGDFDYIEITSAGVSQIQGQPGLSILHTIEYVAATDLVRLGGLNQLDSSAHTPPDPVARYNEANPWADNATVGNTTAGVLVRKAMNLAINKTAIINSIYAGVGSPAPASISIPEWLTTLTPYGYDPTLAQTYLNNAGYGAGFNVTLLYDNRYSSYLNSLAVKSYWDAVGINTTVVYSDGWDPGLRTRWLKGGNTTGNLAGTLDGINYAWMHRTPPASGDPAITVNMAFDPSAVIGDYSEAAEDALRVAMLTELDPVQRTQKLKALGAYVNAQATQVFLVTTYTIVGVKTSLLDEPRANGVDANGVFDLDENPELIHRV